MIVDRLGDRGGWGGGGGGRGGGAPGAGDDGAKERRHAAPAGPARARSPPGRGRPRRRGTSQRGCRASPPAGRSLGPAAASRRGRPLPLAPRGGAEGAGGRGRPAGG